MSNTCIGMFRKVAFVEISKSPLLTAVAGLQSTVYNATKNEHLTKFVKGAFSQVTIQPCKLRPSAVRVCRIFSEHLFS